MSRKAVGELIEVHAIQLKNRVFFIIFTKKNLFKLKFVLLLKSFTWNSKFGDILPQGKSQMFPSLGFLRGVD
jgi:hypothetical protein